MKTTSGSRKRRRKGVPFAFGGMLIGAGLAFWLVRRHKKLMPWTVLDRDSNEHSIYKVTGDFTGDWPAAALDMRPAAPKTAPVAAPLGSEVPDDSRADWGDVPTLMADVPAAVVGAGPSDDDPAMAATTDGAPVTDDTAVAEAPGRKRRGNLEEIEGIGPHYAELLKGAGLVTVDELLQAGADPKGREGLAQATGINKKLILRWVNQADLFRIKGVGEQYADLLEAAGVDTVPELAQRRADNLTKKMVEVNEAKQLVRRTPTEAQVAAWIDEAKALPRMVTY